MQPMMSSLPLPLLLDCEAIHDYNSMLVATVIMNRVESPLSRDSIHGVIYATDSLNRSGAEDLILF